MNHVLANIGQSHPDTDKGRTARVMPLTMRITGEEQRQALWIMAAGVLFVLLIACVDVAVMLLARGVDGSARWRSARRWAPDGCASSARSCSRIWCSDLVSAVAGLLMAWGLTAGMANFSQSRFSAAATFSSIWAVFLAAFAIALLSSLIFGMIPAKKMSSADPNPSLKSGAAAGTDRGDYRLRSGFVVAEVALSLMLLVCTGLVLMQLWRMQHWISDTPPIIC